MEQMNLSNDLMSPVLMKGWDRRTFLSQAGKGILATGLMSATMSANAAESHAGSSSPLPEPSQIKLPSLDDPSEQEKPPVPTFAKPDERIGYAVIGLGHLALNQILPAIIQCKKAKLVALVSGDANKAQNVAAQYGLKTENIYNYQNFDSIKDNKEVKAVYIVLPNGMHEEFVIRSAKAGKHVLCEKPMANTSKEAQNMIDACEQANVKLMIAYRIQYEPKNRFVKDWVRNKEKGHTKLIEAVNTQNTGDPKQWRLNKKLAGGGALPDIGLYCLNTCRYLLGEEPLWVKATTYSTPGDVRFKEVEEAVLWQMGFPGGALANCSTSYGVHETRRYRCITDKGAWMGLDPAFPYKGLQVESEYAEGKNVFKHAPAMGDVDQFAPQMDHFAECIISNKTPYTPGEEGLQDMKIMEAIYQSAELGKRIDMEKIDKIDAFRGTLPKSSE